MKVLNIADAEVRRISSLRPSPLEIPTFFEWFK